MRLAQPIETKREVWLRGVDLNHRPLGYEIEHVAFLQNSVGLIRFHVATLELTLYTS
jgi:hypothetical protein